MLAIVRDYTYKKKYQKAIDYANTSMKTLKSIDSTMNLKRFIESKIELHDLLGNHNKAQELIEQIKSATHIHAIKHNLQYLKKYAEAKKTLCNGCMKIKK